MTTTAVRKASDYTPKNGEFDLAHTGTYGRQPKPVSVFEHVDEVSDGLEDLSIAM